MKGRLGLQGLHFIRTEIGDRVLSYSEYGRVWENYLERVDKTIQSLINLNQLCEDLTKSMWLFNLKVIETMKKKSIL